MKAPLALGFVLLLTTSCSLSNSANDDSSWEFDGTVRESRGVASSGGHAEAGGAPSQPANGSGGQATQSKVGGSTSAGSAGEGSVAGSPGSSACGCERGGRGSTITCDALTGGLGDEAVLWTCDSPPYPALADLGCEGFGSGIFRMCCPKNVTSDDFCPTR